MNTIMFRLTWLELGLSNFYLIHTGGGVKMSKRILVLIIMLNIWNNFVSRLERLRFKSWLSHY